MSGNPGSGTPLQLAIRKLAAGDTLTGDEARDAFQLVMAGEASPVQVSALLMGLRAKGETSAEVAGVV